MIPTCIKRLKRNQLCSSLLLRYWVAFFKRCEQRIWTTFVRREQYTSEIAHPLLWFPPSPYIQVSDNFWSAFCVFHAHFWEKTHIFKICALKKCNDFQQLKRSNFIVEKCKTEENLSKFLNNMAYKTVTSMRDCVLKRKFM